jgi:hypothetical protein
MQKFAQFDLPNLAYRACTLDLGRLTIRQFFAQPYNGRIIPLVDDDIISLRTVAGRAKAVCVTDQSGGSLPSAKAGST